MSLLAALSLRFATSISVLIRAAVQRLGFAPVVLAASAAVALLYSLRARAREQPAPTRRRRRTAQNSNSHSSSPDAKPQWLSRVRRVTIGAKWTRAESCALFCKREEALIQIATTSDRPPDSKLHTQPTDATSSDTRRITSVPDLPLVVRPHVVENLKRFAKLFDIYFVIRIDDDDSEALVSNALDAIGLFQPGYLDPRKLLFCETDTGRISVARQLEPQLHIDETIDVILGLQRFVHVVALVCPDAKKLSSEPFSSNVAKFTSLSSFFA